MSADRIVTAFAVLFLGAGCAGTVGDDVASEEKGDALSVAGDGMPAPMDPLGAPVPLPTGPKLPAPKPLAGDLRDPLGPEGVCGVSYLQIYDPVRARPIDVPVVVCE